MDTGLGDKVVFVTGGSSGIGRATAVAFGREGARVALSYRSDPAGAEETARMIVKAGGEPLVVPYDLGDEGSVRRAVGEIVRRWGALHVLVNNAVRWPGRSGGGGGTLFEEVPPERWREDARTLLEGAYLTIQAVLPHMRAAGWSRIVKVSSTLAEDGMPGGAPYTVAKAGLHGLTRTLAKELAPAGILANVVMPGLTLTERAKQVIPGEVLDGEAVRTPTGRLTAPEEVAALSSSWVPPPTGTSTARTSG
jgi:NAD(P)-dependent dehydrogenase (short-subunit alcohol dehydrogenase family)